jgi:DNA ligase-4
MHVEETRGEKNKKKMQGIVFNFHVKRHDSFTSVPGTNFDVKCLKEGNSIRPCLCVFDVLLYNGQVITNKPLSERLHYLENLFTPSEGIIMHTERKEVTTGQEVMEELNLAIDNRLEGIVLKDPTSIYKPNIRKGGWYKIKPEVSYPFFVAVR